MAGDQLTHGDAVRAGITSVAELSSGCGNRAGPALRRGVSVPGQGVVTEPGKRACCRSAGRGSRWSLHEVASQEG